MRMGSSTHVTSATNQTDTHQAPFAGSTTKLEALDGQTINRLESISSVNRNEELINEAALAYQSRYLAPNSANPSELVSVWSTPKDKVIDCMVVGAGQTGISILALAQGLPGLKVAGIDKAPRGQESIWRGPRCRMPTLRTPLSADVGLELESLSMRRWWASHTNKPLSEDEKLPTHHVNDYLDFVRTACDLNRIDWETELVSWEKEGDHVVVTVRHVQKNPTDDQPTHKADRQEAESVEHIARIKTRALILADGIFGVSVPNIPTPFKAFFSQRNAAARLGPEDTKRPTMAGPAIYHTHEHIPEQNLKDKKVLVVGGGASAYDAGISASQLGAQSVKLSQRGSTPTVNFLIESAHLKTQHGCDPFAAFPSMRENTQRSLLAKIAQCRMPPPKHTVKSFDSLLNTARRENAVIEQVHHEGGKFHVKFKSDPIVNVFDTIILGTGYVPGVDQKPLYADKAIAQIGQEDGLPQKYIGLPKLNLHDEAVIFANESTWTSIGADPGLTSLMPRAQETIRTLSDVLQLDKQGMAGIVPPTVDPVVADSLGQAMIKHLDQCLNGETIPTGR